MTDLSVKVVLLGDTGVGKTSLAVRFIRNEYNPYTESTIGASFMTKTVEYHSSLDKQQVEIKENEQQENEEDDDDDDVIQDTSLSSTSSLWTLTTQRTQGTTTKQGRRRNSITSHYSSQQQHRRRRIEFRIWDTAGQERYQSLAPLYYRNAKVAICMFDICNLHSFECCQAWITQLQHNLGMSNTSSSHHAKSHNGHSSSSHGSKHNNNNTDFTFQDMDTDCMIHQEEEEDDDDEVLLVVCGNKLDLQHHRQVDLEKAQTYAQKVGAFLYMETSARNDENIQRLFQHVAKYIIDQHDRRLLQSSISTFTTKTSSSNNNHNNNRRQRHDRTLSVLSSVQLGESSRLMKRTAGRGCCGS